MALLAYLSACPGRIATRDKILALLWPEAETAKARHLLSGALYDLRRAVGEAKVLSHGDDVALADDEGVYVDVAEFEGACDAGLAEEALRIREGPFMDGFHLSDAPGFEHWLDEERRRLDLLWRDALERAAAERAGRGDAAGAIEAWRRLSADDPCSGRAAVGLMKAFEAAGERAEALRFAATHAALLGEEFGVEPHPDVRALAERLRVAPGGRIADREEDSGVRPSGPPQDAEREAADATPRPTPSPVPPPSERPRKPPSSRPAIRAGWVIPPLLALLVLGSWRALRPTHPGEPGATLMLLETRTIPGTAIDPVEVEALWLELGRVLARRSPGPVHLLEGLDSHVDLARLRTAVGAESRASGRSREMVLEGIVRGTPEGSRLVLRLVDLRDGRLVWSDGVQMAAGDDLTRLAERLGVAVAEAVAGAEAEASPM